MTRDNNMRTKLAALVLLLLIGGLPLLAADSAAEKKADEEKAKAAVTKEFRGRLPMYFGQVVDEKQRQAIYDIQKKYFTEMEILKARLEELTKKRDGEVKAVLTVEQKKKVDEAIDAAKKKRAAK